MMPFFFCAFFKVLDITTASLLISIYKNYEQNRKIPSGSLFFLEIPGPASIILDRRKNNS